MDAERSRSLYDRALSIFPGGVNSPVRAVQPYPRFIDHGEGAHLVDVDGNRYIDYIMGYGPLLLGHTLPAEIRERIEQQLADGPMYGAPHDTGLELAEFISAHVPSIEMLRFVNSGTEATTTAVRLARGYTGRDRIVIADGGYHGGLDATLVSPDGSPASPGVLSSEETATISVPFNNVAAVERAFEQYGEDIAGVLIEPLLGNHGCIAPIEGYLERLRDLTAANDALLIFDEVMTGFRIGGLGCAQGAYGVEPDLTTLAKVIGGGFPVGAVGGRADIMRSLKPAGAVFHASTYAAHPVGMTAGFETLKYAESHDVYPDLAARGDRLRAGVADLLEDRHPSYTVVGRDSMFKVVFSRGDASKPATTCREGCRQDPACARYQTCPKTASDVDAANTARWERLFWHAMCEEGVLLTANQHESQFLSHAHTDEVIDATLEAYKHAL